MTIRMPDGRLRRVILQVERESDKFVVGYPVNRHGELIDACAATRELIIAGHGDIVRRQPMVMNLHYGELEPAPE